MLYAKLPRQTRTQFVNLVHLIHRERPIEERDVIKRVYVCVTQLTFRVQVIIVRMTCCNLDMNMHVMSKGVQCTSSSYQSEYVTNKTILSRTQYKLPPTYIWVVDGAKWDIAQ